MGLLDSVIWRTRPRRQGGGGQAALLQAVIGMLAGQGAPGGGGLADLVTRFQQGGLGDVMSSWVGTGQNMPVSADQLGGVLGDDVLAHLTRSTGLSGGDLLEAARPCAAAGGRPRHANGQLPKPAAWTWVRCSGSCSAAEARYLSGLAAGSRARRASHQIEAERYASPRQQVSKSS